VTSVRPKWDRQLLLSASDDYTMRVWDLETMRCEDTIYGHSGKIISVVS